MSNQINLKMVIEFRLLMRIVLLLVINFEFKYCQIMRNPIAKLFNQINQFIRQFKYQYFQINLQAKLIVFSLLLLLMKVAFIIFLQIILMTITIIKAISPIQFIHQINLLKFVKVMMDFKFIIKQQIILLLCLSIMFTNFQIVHLMFRANLFRLRLMVIQYQKITKFLMVNLVNLKANLVFTILTKSINQTNLSLYQ